LGGAVRISSDRAVSRLLSALLLLFPVALPAADDMITVRSTLSARQNWELSHPRNYSFVLERDGYLAGPGRVRIQVREGRVVQVEDLASGRLYTDEKTLSRYPTIDQLLALIDRAVKRNPDNLTITYDRNLGYPSRIYIDYSYRMADEEVDYRISQVKIEPRG